VITISLQAGATRNPRFQAQHLRDAFRRKKVLTRIELLRIADWSSMTAWRFLESCRYWTSDNFNGRFCLLADIPQFDERGLWAYQGIRFSKWGPLTETMVENSEAGHVSLPLEEPRRLSCPDHAEHEGIVAWRSLRLECMV
jgi:hypothetical protein